MGIYRAAFRSDMKILHVIHDHPAHPKIGGGGAVRVHELARRLASRGHDIHVVSGWFEGSDFYSGNLEGYSQSFLGPKRHPACKAFEFALAAYQKLPQLARGADLVIEDFSPYAPVCAWRLRSIPTILQIQNFTGRAFLGRHGIAGLPLWFTEAAYPRLFAHHILVGEHLRAHFSARDTRVIPMGFTPDNRGDLPPPKRDYIAFLGRMDFHQKGLDLLLEALRGMNLPVWFAGAGPDSDTMEQMVRFLPGSRFLGKLQGVEKWNFLHNARFVVMPSRFEGQPIVAIEAAAAGTPLLASPIPELAFIADSGIGRQFPSLDVETLRFALREMWNAPDLLKSCSESARSFASNRTWDNISIQFEAALLDIANSHA